MYLSGCVYPGAIGEPGVGFMFRPGMGNRLPEGATWAADSGCFNRDGGYVGDEGYLSWLAARAHAADRCLFATVPDFVGDHDATLAVFPSLAPRIRALGYRVAFVAQDGASVETVPWDDFDALFIGGYDAFKLSQTAHDLIAEGKARGKWTHVGRVNSKARILAFRDADSVDGTFLAFGPARRLPEVIEWLAAIRQTAVLWCGA